jgi:hypothetical protein
MRIPPPTMKTPTPISPNAIAQAIADVLTPAATHWRPAGVAEKLMPYEAAAKAIFVKANGLAAYYETTGIAGLPVRTQTGTKPKFVGLTTGGI